MNALQIMLESLLQPLYDDTDHHDVIILLIIMKNRTYLPRPTSTWQGIYKRDVHLQHDLLIILSYAKDKAFNICIGMAMLF